VLELGLDPLAGVGVHAAVEEGETIAAETPSGEELLEPVLGVAVLGEDDHSLVVPPAPAVPVDLGARVLDPVEEACGLGVRATLGPVRPPGQPPQKAQFLIV